MIKILSKPSSVRSSMCTLLVWYLAVQRGTNTFEEFTMRAFGVIAACLFALGSLFAQSNPVPLINQPTVPTSITPGSPDFMLTVNGSGFLPASTVNWNGTPRATTYVGPSQLTATIRAADIL